MLPLLYGALYLWSFWDPYGRLDRIPVALVNEDRGATADGKKLAAGDDLTKGLLDSDVFDWQEVSADQARTGVENGTYYLSYSTGDTHYLVYATAPSVYGPYTYRGRILEPVQGWTTHGSIVEFQGKWYLFYHDTQLSGKTHLRNIKVTQLTYNSDGSIQTISPVKP